MIKHIRECRTKTKKDLYEGIMSASVYKQFEMDISKIRLGDLVKVIDRLDLTKEEFFYYIYKDDINSPIKKFRNIGTFFDKADYVNLIDEFKSDKKYYYTLQAIYYMSSDNFEQAKMYALLLWNILKEYDELFAYDLFCLSHIFPLFEEEMFDQVNNKLIKNFKKWRNFDNFYKTEIAYYLNAGRYFQELKDKQSAITFYQKAYDVAIEYKSGDFTGLSLYRLGKMIDNEQMVKKAESLLELFDSNKLTILKRDN